MKTTDYKSIANKLKFEGRAYINGKYVDAIDDAVAMANVPPDIYTPSEDIYPWLEGGIPEDWINVSQVGGGPNSPGSLLYGIDLESYGFDPKGEFLPKNFLEMLFEGSIVSGNEAVLSDEPKIGTW